MATPPTAWLALVLAGALASPVTPTAAHARALAPADEPAAASEATVPDDQETRIAEASRHYKAGQDLFNRQEYRAAAEAFERSYAVIPMPNTLHDMAASYDLAGESILAIRAYERYLGSAEVDAQERAEIEGSVASLRRRVGVIELEVPEGVQLVRVEIDGESYEPDRFPLLVMPGSLVVELFGAGDDERRKRTVSMSAGEHRTIDVAFEVPEPAATPRPKVEQPPPETTPPVDRGRDRREQTLRGIFWSSVALTVLAGGSIGVLGGLERREERLLEQNKCEPMCSLDENGDPHGFPTEHQDRAEALVVATNAMIGVTAALSIVTLVLGLSAYKRKPRTGRRARGSSVGVTGSTLVVHW